MHRFAHGACIWVVVPYHFEKPINCIYFLERRALLLFFFGADDVAGSQSFSFGCCNKPLATRSWAAVISSALTSSPALIRATSSAGSATRVTFVSENKLGQSTYESLEHRGQCLFSDHMRR